MHTQWADMSEAERSEYAETAHRLHRSNPRRYFMASFAATVGVHQSTLRLKYDPAYKASQTRKVAAWRRKQLDNAAEVGVKAWNGKRVVEPATRADLAERVAEIPPDTRSLTAQIMGDPLPHDGRRRRWAEANPDRRPITLPTKGNLNGL